MPGSKEIRTKIKSVQNTRKITKAMEMVAASKMRRAQEAALRTRAYRNTASEILARLRQVADPKTVPYFTNRTVKNRLYIVITSDRGLAGAYNSNLLKFFTSELKNDAAASVGSSAIMIGRQGARFASRLADLNVLGDYENWPDKPSVNDIKPILETATKLFVDGKIDAVDVLFTDFKSSIAQEVTTHRLLPAAFEVQEIREDLEDALFEPSAKEVLETITPKLIEAHLMQSFLEAAASEHSMRMLAMKNASDNAADLIDDLTLVYNGARQAAITQELAEITGGAEAIA